MFEKFVFRIFWGEVLIIIEHVYIRLIDKVGLSDRKVKGRNNLIMFSFFDT